MLCFHGFPDTAWSFAPLLERLAAAGFHAVAPFMRGYPPSGPASNGDYRVIDLGRDALALIEAFGAQRAFLVGHDWGAAAVYIAAAIAPERVEKMITAGLPHLRRFLLTPNLRQLKRSRYMGFFQLRGIPEKRIVADDFKWLRALIREWSPGWRFSEEDFDPVKAAFSDPACLSAALSYYRAMPRNLASFAAWRLLFTPIQTPTRMICGADDGCVGPEMFTGQEKLFSAGFELITLDGAGHFMHREQPDTFSQLVIDFIK